VASRQGGLALVPSVAAAPISSITATRKSEPSRARSATKSQAQPRQATAKQKPSRQRGASAPTRKKAKAQASARARQKAKTAARHAASAQTRTIRTSQQQPVLTWRPVPGATFYAVRLFRGDVRILDLWPSTTRVRVPASWVYGGVHFRLRPGRYLWYVYPGIGNASRLRLGKLAKAGVLLAGAGSR